ncbi:MAG: hypothetical protein F6K10_23275, partial [Moorea sp. SIO2B7]|nr:hypothetical protein [Moorena sp. SIO2B7]
MLRKNIILLSKLLLITIFSLPISGCSRAIFYSPQIPSGGVNSKSPDQYPAYSSDGRYLAFASDRNGRRDIYLYDLQKRTLVPLPNLNRRDSSQDQPAVINFRVQLYYPYLFKIPLKYLQHGQPYKVKLTQIIVQLNI